MSGQAAATERLPPHNTEAEQSLLGSLLIDRDAIVQVIDLIRDPDRTFFHGANATIYRAIRWLFEQRVPADFVTLVDTLKRYNRLEQVGGTAYLGSLLTTVPTAVHARYYAEIVLRCAARRAVIDAGARIAAEGYRDDDRSVDVEPLVRDLRASVEPFAVEPARPTGFVDLLCETSDVIRSRWDGVIDDAIVRTGFASLDRVLGGGYRRKQLIYFGARPGFGKSSWVLQSAMASRSVIFSIEMGADELGERLVAIEANVPFDRLRSPLLDVDQRRAVELAEERLAKLSRIVEIRDEVDRLGAMEAIVERLRAEHRVEAVFVDHLGLLKDNDHLPSEYQKTTRNSKELKRMAKRLDVALVVLAQLNRDVTNRSECLPFLQDFRDSGSIEQDADVAILGWRRTLHVADGQLDPDPAKDYLEEDPSLDRVVLSVAKNRNGERRPVVLGWRGPVMKFHEIARAA